MGRCCFCAEWKESQQNQNTRHIGSEDCRHLSHGHASKWRSLPETKSQKWYEISSSLFFHKPVYEVVHNAFGINSLESPEATTAFFLPLLNALEAHFVVTHGRTTIDDWNSPFSKTEDLGMEQEHFVNETYDIYLQYAYNTCVFWVELYFNLFPGD